MDGWLARQCGLAVSPRFHVHYDLSQTALKMQGATPLGGPLEGQWEYDDWLARQCSLAASPAEPWRRRLAPLLRQRIFLAAETFRDEFDEEELALAAQAQRAFEPHIHEAKARAAA